MTCVICKQGKTQDGTATVTLEREGIILVVKSVPARVCNICGEEYVDEGVAEELLRHAEESEKAGIQIDIRTYAAA
jgi:YgiT-type zinc finger domain-containing protein